MDNQKYKLEKLKKAQKAKSSRDELFNSYLDKTTKIEDKIALVKFKQKDNNSVFLSSLKTLMKQQKIYLDLVNSLKLITLLRLLVAEEGLELPTPGLLFPFPNFN